MFSTDEIYETMAEEICRLRERWKKVPLDENGRWDGFSCITRKGREERRNYYRFSILNNCPWYCLGHGGRKAPKGRPYLYTKSNIRLGIACRPIRVKVNRVPKNGSKSRQVAYQERKIKAGLCGQCGTNPLASSRLCIGCLDKPRNRYSKARRKVSHLT